MEIENQIHSSNNFLNLPLRWEEVACARVEVRRNLEISEDVEGTTLKESPRFIRDRGYSTPPSS